jgi:DeoR/GlpR family transcriptional regulator of sugar metabolism
MLNEERRQTVELLQNEGRVLVRDLSKRFHTSLIAIRKDLELLHHQGLLERTHGGALPVRTLSSFATDPKPASVRNPASRFFLVRTVTRRNVRPCLK